MVEGLVTYDFTLHLRAMTTLCYFESFLGWLLDASFGLSQFNGHTLGSCVKRPLDGAWCLKSKILWKV